MANDPEVKPVGCDTSAGDPASGSVPAGAARHSPPGIGNGGWPIELGRWTKDLSRYFGLFVHRSVLPNLGRGVDYTAAEYKDKVEKVVRRYHPRRMKLELVDIIPETNSTKTFRFNRLDDILPPFRAGQYINLFLEIGSVRTSRPYSISSAPGDAHLDLTVRLKPGGFAAPHLFARATMGDVFESTGPSGHFYWEPLIDGRRLVFLAGGSGITPFMSIIRDQARHGWEVDIDLLYGSRTPEDIVFGSELEELSSKYSKLRYTAVISEPPAGYSGVTGLLDGKLIEERLPDLKDHTYYVCGPNPMIQLCLAELKRLGVPAHRIRREAYGPPDDVVNQPGWPHNVSADDTFEVEVEGFSPFTAKAGEPLLASFERHGITVPAVCRSGDCSACRTRILSGRVFMPPTARVRESDLLHGQVHACVCYPLENLKIRL